MVKEFAGYLFIGLLFVLQVFCAPDFAIAKTLIVTHPEKEFDRQSAAGPTSRAHLMDSIFDRKILVLTPLATENEVTFSLIGLNYELVRSPDGVLNWQGDDHEITIAGGYATACMFGSLLSVIQASRSNLQITLPMGAIYAMQLSFIYGSTNPELTKNLKEWKSHFDAKIFDDFLKDYGSYLLERIPFRHGFDQSSGRQASEYKISICMNGKEISSFGSGSQIIKIDFSE